MSRLDITDSILICSHFHKLNRSELKSCIEAASSLDPSLFKIDQEEAVKQSIRAMSRRESVRTVSRDDESLNQDAIEAEAWRYAQGESTDLNELFERAAAASRNPALPKTMRNFLARLAKGELNHSDLSRWTPRVVEIRALIEGGA